jgi:N-acetylmuramoyl-L-alanine amidase
MKIAMSSGHSKAVRGAAGPSPWGLDEVNEARKVVETTATELRELGVDCVTFHDDTSTSQSANLNRIVSWHNSQTRDADLSIHFNAYQVTQGGRGHESLYTSSKGEQIAKKIVGSVCTASGLINRGAKYRSDLAFLNGTNKPACLVEVCFVDAKADTDIYRARYGDICSAIAGALAGEDAAPGPEPEPPDGVLFFAEGTCSTFGGPADTGVSPSEGLAFIYDYDEAPWLFLPYQPAGTTGLARRLDPSVFYLACRWPYNIVSKEMLKGSGQMALVTAKDTGVSRLAHPADWGPHEEQTGRAADLSPALAESLGVGTDDEVTVIYPAGG